MKNKLINLLIVLLLAVSIGFGAKAIYEYRNLEKSKDLYDQIILQVQNIKEQEQGSPHIEGLPLMQYAEIQLQNPDFYGWIKIDGTHVNYPVMHTPNDPEYYLRRDFNGDYSIPGTIFMDGRNSKNDDNLIIYGHYMENGTMFGDILNYADEAYFKEHPVIHFDDIYHENEYEIMAVFFDYVHEVDDTDFKYYNFINAYDESEFDYVIDTLHEKSLYDTNVDAEYGDQLITLSTCSYHVDDGRFVVVAVKHQDK